MAAKLCQVVGGPNKASGWVSGKQVGRVLSAHLGPAVGCSSPGRSPMMGLGSQTCAMASSGSMFKEEHMVAF